MIRSFLIATMMLPGVALADGLLQSGYYAGLSTLYPYDPVYCGRDDGRGPCYGVYLHWAKSAPLPPYYTWCKAADPDAHDLNHWFWWRPRHIESPRSIAGQVCYWEDRGEPHDINDMPKED